MTTGSAIAAPCTAGGRDGQDNPVRNDWVQGGGVDCPKCGFINAVELESCARCGVVFAKLRHTAQPERPLGVEVSVETDGGGRSVPAQLLLGPDEEVPVAYVGLRALVWVGLAVWGGWLVCSGLASNAAGESVLHLINLPFHEAGHVFLRPFGRFLASLGGTLMQLLVPLLCLAVLLLKTRDAFGAAVCAWWFGENLLDIAPYINDARAGVLPLVGGNFGNSSPYGFHDWEYLLTETGLLRFDHTLALLTHIGGGLMMLLALGWGVSVLRHQWQQRV